MAGGWNAPRIDCANGCFAQARGRGRNTGVVHGGSELQGRPAGPGTEQEVWTADQGLGESLTIEGTPLLVNSKSLIVPVLFLNWLCISRQL